MCILYHERIKQQARKLIKGGGIIGLAIFRNSDGVIEEIVTNEQQASLWIMNNEPKDEAEYSVTTVDLISILDKEGCYEIK